MSSMNRRKVPYHTRLKSNFDRLMYIIFFITQIHRVRFVSVNEETARVRPSKTKKIEKKLEKNFGTINYKTKIFITKIYSNIDKGHTFFALLAPFDKTGQKTGSNEIVCGI